MASRLLLAFSVLLVIVDFRTCNAAAFPSFATVAGTNQFTLRTSFSAAVPQQTAYDDRTDTLYMVTGTTDARCGILALQQASTKVNATSTWAWRGTAVSNCSLQPLGLAWAKGTSFGRPDSAENDVLFFSAYTTGQLWAHSPALNATVMVVGGLTYPEGIAFIDSVAGVPRTAVVVADYGNACIREVRIVWLPSSQFGKWSTETTTVAGVCGLYGDGDGAALGVARLSVPRNIAFVGDNSVMYIGDGGSLRVLTGYGTAAATVTTVNSNAGLSVATMATGGGGDKVVFVDSDGYPCVDFVATNGSAVPTVLRRLVFTPAISGEVRFATLLWTGQMLVTTRFDVFTSTQTLASGDFSAAYAPRAPPATPGPPVVYNATLATGDITHKLTVLWIVIGIFVPIGLAAITGAVYALRLYLKRRRHAEIRRPVSGLKRVAGVFHQHPSQRHAAVPVRMTLATSAESDHAAADAAHDDDVEAQQVFAPSFAVPDAASLE